MLQISCRDVRLALAVCSSASGCAFFVVSRFPCKPVFTLCCP
ncbi:hypothetical protein RM6536_0993 [Rothia mucilaginosa]|uniref:Lipoprotein n=1 Tax=Rothia mucilaginosa TaxID=43675 RepID=A0A0K2RZM7_9MICC|nr:hypothetical protein RM6536_0993 [Rothia mucilaginosa]